MTVNEQKASVIALGVILTMILVNMIGILRQWMLSRQSIVKAMYLSGASFFQIKTKLAREYTLLLSIAYIAAIIIAYILTFIPWSIYKTFEISITSIIISFIVYILFALPGMMFILIKRQEIKK